MALINLAQKNLVSHIIGEMGETFAKDEVIYRTFSGLDRFGEDSVGHQKNDQVLLGLFSYNYFRQWGINATTVAGVIDKDTEAVIFTMKYLREQNLINDKGYFKFKDKGQDRLIHRGVIYSIVGDTPLSQLVDSPLLYMLVLRREEVKTGYQQSK